MTDRREQVPAGAIETFDLQCGPIEPYVVAGIRFVRYHAAFAQPLAEAMSVPVETVFERCAAAAQAFLAVLPDDRIAAYGWVNHDMIRIYELNLAVPIPRGHAYIWDCATLPLHRGRGIFAGLLRFVVEDLRLQGDVWAWGAVAPGNEPSLHAFARAGFRLVASAHLGIGQFELIPTVMAASDEVAFLHALRPVAV